MTETKPKKTSNRIGVTSILLIAIFSLMGIACSNGKRDVIELCPSLCEDKICMLDGSVRLAESDVVQLLLISKEYEAEGLDYTNINLESLNDLDRFRLYAFKCDYYGVEIDVERNNGTWKKLSVRELLF